MNQTTRGPDKNAATILAHFRAKIDLLDGEICSLLEKRLDLAGQIQQIKLEMHWPPRDPEREQTILEKLTTAHPRLPHNVITSVYQSIFSAALEASKNSSAGIK